MADTDLLPAWGASTQQQPSQDNLFYSGLVSGLHKSGATLASALQGVSQAAGLKDLAQWGKETADSQTAAATASGRQDLEEASWYNPKKLAYQAMQGLPQIAAAVGGGMAATALLPEAAAGAAGATAMGMGARGLGLLGAGVASYPFSFGGNVEAAKAANNGQLSDTDTAKAAALAVPEAAIAGWMPHNLEEVLRNGAGGKLAERVFKGAWTNAAVQAPAAAIQTAMTQQAFTPNMSLPDRAKEIVHSALTGGAQGAMFGGTIHGLSKAKDPAALDNAALDKATADALAGPQGGAVVSPEDPAHEIPTGSPDLGPVTAGHAPVNFPDTQQVIPPANPLAHLTDEQLGQRRDVFQRRFEDALGDSPDGSDFAPKDELHLRAMDAEIAQRKAVADARIPKDDQLGPEIADAPAAPGSEPPVAGDAQTGVVPNVPRLVDGTWVEPNAAKAAIVAPEEALRQTVKGVQGGLENSTPDAPSHRAVPFLVDPNTGSVNDLAQSLGGRTKVVSRHTDMAEGIADVAERAAADPTALNDGERAVLDHVGLTDSEGKPVPVETALETARGNLKDARRENHGMSSEDLQAVKNAHDHVEVLTKIKEAFDTRQAAKEAIAAIKGAEDQHTAERVAAMSTVPMDLHKPFIELEKVIDNPHLDPNLQEPLIQLQMDMDKSEGRTPESLLSRMARLLPRAQKDIADRIAAKEVSAKQAEVDAPDLNQWGTEGPLPAFAGDKAGVNLPSHARTTSDTLEAHGMHQILGAGGSGKDVLAFASKSAADPVHRALAEQMLAKGFDTPIREVGPDHESRQDTENRNDDASRPNSVQFGERVADYDAGSNVITVYNRGLATVPTMLHELVHGATARAIFAGGRAAKEMERLFERVGKFAYDTGDMAHYGLQSVHEFVAEAMSNPRFQEFLKNARMNEIIDGVPSSSLWQRFKNSVFKVLGMDEKVRTALNDVLDVGHRLMDEQLRLTDGRVVPADQAPHVGSVPDSERVMASFASDTAKTLGDIGTRLLNGHLARDAGLGQLNLSEKMTKLLLGWRTPDGMIGIGGHFFKGQMENFYSLKRTFDGLRERSAQPDSQTTQALAAFKAAFPKTYPIFNGILHRSQVMNSDPRLDWAHQPDDVKNRPDKHIIAPIIEADHRSYQTFIQNGGAKVFEKMITSSNGDKYRYSTALLHKLVETMHGDAGIIDPAAPHPGDAYLGMSELHNSPELAKQYWEKTFDDLRKSSREYLTKREAEAAKFPKLMDKNGDPIRDKAGNDILHPEAQKIMDATSDLRDGLNSLEAQEKQMLSRPNLHLGRSGDFFSAMQLVKDSMGRPLKAATDYLRSELDKADFKDIGISTAGENKNNHVYIRSENLDQAAQIYKIMQDMHEKGYSEAGTKPSEGNRSDLKREMLRDMAPGWMDKMISRLEAKAEEDAKSGKAGADPELQKRMHSEMRALWLDMVPDNSIHRVLEHREGVQGFNTDMAKNFAVRLQTGINASAHLMTTGRLFDALGSMAEQAERMKSDPSFSPRETVLAHQLVSEIATREARRPWSLKNTFLDTALAMNHSYFIGLSPGYATELMSQVGTLMWPELSKRYGYLQSAQALGKAFPETMQIMKAVMDSGHLTDATITPDALRKAGIKPATIDLIMGVANRGGLELGSFTRALLGDASGRLSTSGLSTAMKVSNALAVNSEVMPRILAALTARDLHAADTRANKPVLEHYVDHVIEQSMMNWATYTTPRHLGKMGFAGALTPLVTKFMSFQTKMLEKLHRETITGFFGHADAITKRMDDLTPVQQKAKAEEMKTEARRFMAAHLSMTAALAGTMGLPFAGAIAGAASNLGNFLTNSNDFDLETGYRKGLVSMFGETAGTAIARGLPRLANIDLSELGEDRLLPFSDFMSDKRKWEEASTSMAWRALGSPVSMAGNIIRGGRDIWMGNTLNGMRELVPSAGKNLVDMYRMTNYGYIDKEGRKLPIGDGRKGEASTMDILKQAVGLHSGDLADYEERSRGLEGYKERRQFLSQTLMVRLAKAIESGNSEDIRSTMAEAQAFGKANPLHNPLAQIGNFMSNRARAVAQARATGAPLGTSIKDQKEMWYATP